MLTFDLPKIFKPWSCYGFLKEWGVPPHHSAANAIKLALLEQRNQYKEERVTITLCKFRSKVRIPILDIFRQPLTKFKVAKHDDGSKTVTFWIQEETNVNEHSNKVGLATPGACPSAACWTGGDCGFGAAAPFGHQAYNQPSPFDTFGGGAAGNGGYFCAGGGFGMPHGAAAFNLPHPSMFGVPPAPIFSSPPAFGRAAGAGAGMMPNYSFGHHFGSPAAPAAPAAAPVPAPAPSFGTGHFGNQNFSFGTPAPAATSFVPPPAAAASMPSMALMLSDNLFAGEPLAKRYRGGNEFEQAQEILGNINKKIERLVHQFVQYANASLHAKAEMVANEMSKSLQAAISAAILLDKQDVVDQLGKDLALVMENVNNYLSN